MALSATEEKLLSQVAAANRMMGALTFLFGILLLVGWVLPAWLQVGGDTSFRMPQDMPARPVLVIVGTYVGFAWIVAVLHLVLARRIAQRRAWRLCLALAGVTGLNCLCAPVNTVVTIATIAMLLKPSVRGHFEGGA